MKLVQSLALLTGASFTILPALTNFHISQSVSLQSIASGVSDESLIACPSNDYTCDCLEGGNRAAKVMVYGQGVPGNLPDSFFSVNAGLCGSSQLNFYNKGGGIWEFYQNNGDGSLKGTCYPNSASPGCPGYLIDDQLVCYSNICGS